MTLTMNFQGQIWNLLYLSWKWSDCYETKSKHIDWTPTPKWPWKVRCEDLTDSDRGDFRCCPAIDSSSFLPNPHNRHPIGLPFVSWNWDLCPKGWANSWDAGDLRCHHTHYDVTLMGSYHLLSSCLEVSFEYWYHWNFLRTGESVAWVMIASLFFFYL